MSKGETADPPPRELVLVGGRNPESGGYRVLRQRADSVEVGELRALQEGQPLNGDVVRLHPTAQHARIFECETLHAVDDASTSAELPAAELTEARADEPVPTTAPLARQASAPGLGTAAGPRQVATPTYRQNWEQIFGALAKGLDESTSEILDTVDREDDPVPPDAGKLN